VSAIRAAGGDVTYLRFSDEGHDFTKLANRAHAYRMVAAFLEKQFTRARAPRTREVR
jgi:dipeptidyl aminopeptidase/acylaminoacyl peptidase